MEKPMQPYGADSGPIPQPMRNGLGATDPGPRNVLLDRQNPALLASPSTDHGTLPNLKFSFSQAHNRLSEAMDALRKRKEPVV